ncbi:MAG: TIGR00730 family Rossman fold protein [Rhodospirillales bacterium]|nr:TIGR00730 family Rossman fold protein [Rhodospirillales bacterium]
MVAIKSLCVYCGSSDRGPRTHRTAAGRFGRILAEADIELVFGGGHVGLMGVIADAALTHGGRVTGIIPEHLLNSEAGHGKVSELIVVPNMHTRKETMFRRSEAFVILPGGPGTLDETFEVLTWKQLRLHAKPIVLVNLGGYWQPLLDLVRSLIRRNYARPTFRDLFTVVERVEDVLPTIGRMAAPRIAPKPQRL